MRVLRLCLLVLTGLGWTAASASAARQPTPREAKALAQAFAHDHRHPAHATIVTMRVSTVNGHWSLVKWFVSSSHKAVMAKPKIITLQSSTYSGPPAHPKPATTRPPRKVQQDLNHDQKLVVTYTLNGREDAAFHTSTPDDSCGQDTEDGSLTSTFSWTATWEIDVDRPFAPAVAPDGSLQSLSYYGRAENPTLGQASDSFTDTTKQGCYGGTSTITCSPTWKASKYLNQFDFDAAGVLMPDPLGRALPSNATCSDGRPFLMNYTSRWNGVNLGAGVPLRIRGAGFNVGPFSVSFPRSAPYHSGGVTSSSLGVCSSKSGCTDTLQWSGTVTVKVG